jgi:hypothetical protein
MSSLAQKSSAARADILSVRFGAPHGDQGADLISLFDAGRAVEGGSLCRADLREKLDMLERDHAMILSRLDRMANRHRALVQDAKAAH